MIEVSNYSFKGLWVNWLVPAFRNLIKQPKDNASGQFLLLKELLKTRRHIISVPCKQSPHRYGIECRQSSKTVSLLVKRFGKLILKILRKNSVCNWPGDDLEVLLNSRLRGDVREGK